MRSFFVAILAVLSAGGYAGDVAIFQNLGFSNDGRYFQFGQYGVDSQTQAPYAQIFTVEVPRNTFVPNSAFRGTFPGGASLGDDGRKALLALMDQAATTRRRLGVDAVRLGRPIFFRVNGDNAEGKNVTFIDYQTSRDYSLKLTQTVTPSGSTVQSSFYIDLVIKTEAGQTVHTSRIGTPSIQRRGVTDYRIHQVILGPTEREIVVIVERLERGTTPDDVNIRYMAETGRISP